MRRSSRTQPLKELTDATANGGWEAETEFRVGAQLALRSAQEWNGRLDEIWNDPKIHGGGPLNDEQRVRLREAVNSFRRYADAAVLNCALAAASTMNFYGET